jgi:hypothetical protein
MQEIKLQHYRKPSCQHTQLQSTELVAYGKLVSTSVITNMQHNQYSFKHSTIQESLLLTCYNVDH